MSLVQTLATTALVSLVIPISAFAAASPKLKSIATLKANCSIDYDGAITGRSLIKNCHGSKSPFFSLEDNSAPLIESKVVTINNHDYLVTRWSTGKSESLFVFDLKSDKALVVDKLVSDGPITLSVDKAKQKITMSYVEKAGEGATATARTLTHVWP